MWTESHVELIVTQGLGLPAFRATLSGRRKIKPQHCVQFSPDGKYLAAVDTIGGVTAWKMPALPE